MRFRALVDFLRANPQAAILLALWVVLGSVALVASMLAVASGATVR